MKTIQKTLYVENYSLHNKPIDVVGVGEASLGHEGPAILEIGPYGAGGS